MAYRILLIDNEKEYCEALKNNASIKGIKLNYKYNYEEGFELLKNNFNDYQGVIFDAKCFKGKLEMDKNEESEVDIYGAIIDLKDLIKSNGNKPIPYCVNTGFGHEFKAQITAMKVPVFEKNNKGRDAMFEYFKSEIDKLPENIIRAKYPEPFSAFGNSYLPIEKENLLINIIKLLEEDTFSNIEEILFTPVRMLLEATYIEINFHYENILPYELLNYENGRVNLEWCLRKLTGQEISIGRGRETTVLYVKGDSFVPLHISWFLTTITRITNSKSHDSEAVSRYTINTILFGIMDYLVWFKNKIDEKQK